MKINSLIINLSIIVLFSCRSDPPTPPNPPTTLRDTLSIGWTAINFGNKELYDIVFQNNSLGYLASQDSMFQTTDAGITWNRRARIVLRNIAVSQDGTLIGTNMETDTMFRSVNGAGSFTGFKTNKSPIYDCCFADMTTAYATFFAGMMQSTNGGVTWQVISPMTGVVIGPGSFFFIPAFVNPTTGWYADLLNVYKMNGNINTWTRAVFNVQPAQSARIFIMAPSANTVYFATENGEVFKSTNGGANFTFLTRLNSSGPLDIDFVNDYTGYISIGTRIFKTTDGGSNWQTVVSLDGRGVYDLEIIDANHGWACGSQGLLLRFQL